MEFVCVDGNELELIFLTLPTRSIPCCGGVGGHPTHSIIVWISAYFMKIYIYAKLLQIKIFIGINNVT